MIILFTANSSGGICQFMFQMMHELDKNNISYISLVPDTTEDYLKNCKNTVCYSRQGNIIETAKELKQTIISKNPTMVWFMECSILSSVLNQRIHKRIKTFLTLHDVSQHPTYFKKAIKSLLLKHYTKKSIKCSKRILLLSQESQNLFNEEYKKHSSKTVLMNLGAHIPNNQPICPPELTKKDTDYFLFFGRIDKYKGIEQLISAYSNIQKPFEHKLIIAGSGLLPENTKNDASLNKQITLLNRYIDNGEMKWLFQNCRAVVLPYLEASQSGVIPIAYYYGKPVIVSNILGLTQYVDENKTGLITNSTNSLRSALQSFDSRFDSKMYFNNTKDYYNRVLDWSSNFKAVLEVINE